MHRLLLFIIGVCVPFIISAQCTTTNATSCQCLTQGSTDCDLLPDITVSEYAFLTFQGGPNEFPQTNAGTSVNGQGPDDGRYRLSGSTPNIGRGAMEVRAVDQFNKRWFLCGTDTVSILDPNATAQFTCPNGNPNPRQLLKQRVYHKNGSSMSFYERFAGSMTYHPTHGHYHVDDWELMTIRLQDTTELNPLKWPIVGQGIKVGFCIEDYQSCSTANGHCRDSLDNILTNGSFVNYGMGGGTYSCGIKFQGITVGYTDIYWETLDGQWINIPPNTCNGNYWVVIQVDPNNYFLESNENNNYFASPITLTQQSPAGNPVIEITTNKTSSTLCPGDSLTLTATAGNSILWSTGATTQTIQVPSNTGTYSVTVTNHCGTDSATYQVNEVAVAPAPTAMGDSICGPGNAQLSASGTGVLKWYDANGNYLSSGPTFTTPTISSTSTYYVEDNATHPDTAFATPQNNNLGAGDWINTVQYLTFNAETDFILHSVKVYAQGTGNRTIQLQNSSGAVLQTTTVNIVAGVSRVALDFPVPAGTGYRLACTTNSTGLSLYRNNSSSVSFPYGVPGVVTITGSSAGASYYYFFYNWKISTNALTCPGPKTPVVAYVSACTGYEDLYHFKNTITVYPNPSGDGLFNLSFSSPTTENIMIRVTDMVGRKVFQETVKEFTGNYSKAMSLSNLAKGVYQLSIIYKEKPYSQRLIIN
jgi:hypothetical protein